jgi:hypothetical protein
MARVSPAISAAAAFQIGEQECDVADRNSFRGFDDLRAEQIAEGLRHQQPLAGQEGLEFQHAARRPAWRTWSTPKIPVWSVVTLVTSKTTLPGARVPPFGAQAPSEKVIGTRLTRLKPATLSVIETAV